MKKLFLASIAILLLKLAGVAQTDTEFWFAAPEVMQHTGSNLDRPILLRITTYSAPATVTITIPSASSTLGTLLIPANSFQSFDLTTWIGILECVTPNTVLISPGSVGPPYDSELETGNRIYMHTDQKAKPPGMKELMKNKLKYPKEALENGISGIVKVQMVNKQELASAGKTGENTSTYGYHDSKKSANIVVNTPTRTDVAATYNTVRVPCEDCDADGFKTRLPLDRSKFSDKHNILPHELVQVKGKHL